ncbi:hypothetical protein N2K95_03540 [Arthrobacter zhaoxinii]|uniref:Uncharacterized protein n=1 Tax=Arthrobacter zhaoxinii TaxID=2964616 RepID=A0ABY5YVV3_9MICC|nr:hypothetical protein [Arthrobacter zhaoxinii]UWX97770.1 hypothetical protein N2K95_03540 [Arthrobacter zhaoxinii]
MPLFSTKPIVEKKEQWTSALPPQEVLDALASAFLSHGEDVRREKSSVEVHLGSNALYRTWGNMTAEGRANIPVALCFTVAESGTGAALSVHAFDTFGFRFGSGKSFGVPETFNRRLEEFLSYAAGVVGIDRPVAGPVPAPPRFNL